MRALLDIHGVSAEVRCPHRGLFQTLLKDLEPFRVSGPCPQQAIRFSITALPSRCDGESGSGPFAPYQRFFLVQPQPKEKRVIARYGASLITVISDLEHSRIAAAMVPDPALLPDPGCSYLFTQPLSLHLKRRGLFLLHAACVADGNLGALIIGQPRSGKSVLTVAAVRQGFRFLSDEHPLLTLRNGRPIACSFPRRVRLDRQVASLIPELRRLAASSRLSRIAFPITRFWPNAPIPRCTLRILLFPKFRRQPGIWTYRVHPITAMRRLLQDDYFVWYRGRPWVRISHTHLELFRQMAERLPAFVLEYSDRDLAQVPNLIRRLLRQAR